MSPVRPATPDDLPGAAPLFQRMMPGYAGIAGASLEAFLRGTFLDNPATDPEIPSLVYEASDGRITGFIGTQVRPMRFDGRPVRAASASHLVADPDEHLPIGVLLLRALLTGHQDVTTTDTAIPTVTRMWLALGGRPRHLGGIEWIRLFKPATAAVNKLTRRRSKGNRAADVAAGALDSALGIPLRGFLGPRPADGRGEALTPASLLQCLPELTESLRLVPYYDESYLEWLFAELSRRRPDGRTVATLVRTENRVAGWYIYRLEEGELSQVAEVAAQPRDAGYVLDHLIEHASVGGAAGLRGRVEPHLLAALSERRCGLRYIGGPLVHSRHPDLVDAINSGSAMLSRLDGEWTALRWPDRGASLGDGDPEPH